MHLELITQTRGSKPERIGKGRNECSDMGRKQYLSCLQWGNKQAAQPAPKQYIIFDSFRLMVTIIMYVVDLMYLTVPTL